METKNLEWLVFNALHGDINGDVPEDLQVILKAEQEFNALRFRVADLESIFYNAVKANQQLKDRVARLEEALKEIKQRAEFMNWGSVAKIASNALEGK